MKRKPFAAVAPALIFALVSTYSGNSSAQDRSKPAAPQIKRMSIATGAIGGIYNVLGGGMAKLLREKLSGIDVTAETTNASVDNVRLVGTKQTEIGFSN